MRYKLSVYRDGKEELTYATNNYKTLETVWMIATLESEGEKIEMYIWDKEKDIVIKWDK